MASLSNTISVSAGGIDVISIVQGLMSAERMPLVAIQNRQTAAQTQLAGIKGIKTGIEALGKQVSAILAAGLAKYSATSSNPAAVSVTLGAAARTGSVQFTVDQLASNHGLRTATTVASSATAITTAARLAVSTTSAPLGVTGVGADDSVAAGSYTLKVTQATAGATIAGSGAVAASTVIDGTNNSLALEVDGVARTVTIADGTYTAAALRDALQSSLDASGGGVTASLDATNHLKLTTTHEGSAATLGIQSGSALTAVGFSVTYPAVAGTDGAIQLGTNPAIVVTSAGLRESVSLSTGSGNLNVTLGAGLRVGESKVAVVSTGDRSLAAVASAINSSNSGATASAVRSADGAWLLQVNSSKTGSASALALDANAFTGVGGLVETSAAQDARITIGSGAGAYSVTAAGNTFTDVLPGTTINVNAASATPVTVTVGDDTAAVADAVSKLVDQANAVVGLAAEQTRYDAATRTVAPLAGDSTVRGLAASVRSAVTSVVTGGGTPLLSADYGITAQKDGTLKFDRDLFLKKLATDPDAAERLFNRHGTGTGGVTFASATEGTSAGTYAVEVTTAATRATTGVVLVGGSAGGQQIGVRVGTTTVTYDAAAGATATDIASGLNAKLAQAGLGVTAEVSGGGVQLTSTKFGYAGGFESNLDVLGGGSWASNAGTDVQGTINGETAVGSGNRLSLLNLGRSPARGLAVDIDEGVSGVLPPVEYQPGVAARLANLVSNLTGTLGSLTTSAGAYEAKLRGFNDQVAKFEDRLTRVEANYRRQWTAVQTALNSLQNQQNWLGQQLSGLSPDAG